MGLWALQNMYLRLDDLRFLTSKSRWKRGTALRLFSKTDFRGRKRAGCSWEKEFPVSSPPY